jgi:hypothetical protein
MKKNQLLRVRPRSVATKRTSATAALSTSAKENSGNKKRRTALISEWMIQQYCKSFDSR